MTVIAWDGRTLAADKRCVANGMPRTVTKVFRARGALVGFSGEATLSAAMLAWWRDGAQPEKFPRRQADTGGALMLVIRRDGQAGSIRIEAYEHDPEPAVYEDRFVAFGSGRDCAMAAMHLGHDAIRAVEVACALDVHCGNGYDALTLEG